MRNLTALLIAAMLATPAIAAPNAQLTHSIANRLAFYNVRVDPDALNTAQAAALHILLVSERGYLQIQRKARAILRSEQFRD